jgi:protein O-mannosyl-transferase
LLRSRISRLFARNSLWPLTIIIGLGTFALYLPTARFGFVNYDDAGYVYKNAVTLSGLSWRTFCLSFTQPSSLNWHPFTMLSFLFDASVWHAQPGPIHVENAILHAAAASLLFIAFAQMTGSHSCSAMMAALFAVHPAHVESVAWISERKDVLSGLFTSAMLLAYWHYTRRPGAWRYIVLLAFYAAALLSKPSVVPLPFALLLLDFWPLQRLSAGALYEKLPLMAMAASSAIITILVQGASVALDLNTAIPIPTRLANASVSIARYLLKAVAPLRLSPFYPIIYAWPAPVVSISLLLIALITLAALRWRKRYPFLVVGWFWFLLFLLPTIGLVQAGAQSIADRYTYLPFIGLSVAAVWGAAEFVKALKLSRITTSALASCLLVACIILTLRQQPIWADSISLWTYASDITPSWVAEFHLANAYATDPSRTHDAEAISCYTESLRLNPYNAEAQAQLGYLLMHYSPALAEPHYRAAIKLHPKDPLDQYWLGQCLQAQNRPQEAAAAFRAAIALDPTFTPASQALSALH